MKPSPPSLPANRSFVVQLHKDAKPAQGDVRGRVEHLVSGEAEHFASLEELQVFMSRLLTAQDETREAVIRGVPSLLAFSLSRAHTYSMHHSTDLFFHRARQASGKRTLKILVLLALLSLPPLRCAAAPLAFLGQGTLLDSFEQYPLLAFPSQWRVRGDEAKARLVYQVAEEHGDRFLHAHAERQALQIGIAHAVQPRAFPRLRWRWRVLQLPPGGDEGRKETHDSAAGVYVIFDNPILPRIIKYVWSTTVPAGTHVQNPLYWRAKIIVLGSGAAGLGEWRQETVNFYQDYQALFGAEPGRVLGIGLMTSSSFTQSVASADYDDFLLLPPEVLPAAASPVLSVQRLPAALD